MSKRESVIRLNIGLGAMGLGLLLAVVLGSVGWYVVLGGFLSLVML